LVIEQLPAEWREVVHRWAEREPLIVAAFAFGSRAKGVARPDSDLDLAVVVAGADEGERDCNWICEAGGWKNALQSLLPVEVDLWSIGDNDERVRPAVEEHGIQLFVRSSQDLA
jgi:predicted nucleotidyltransferase